MLDVSGTGAYRFRASAHAFAPAVVRRMALPIGRSLGLLAGVALAWGATACGAKEPPPQLPTTGAHDRAASRIELVDLVIGDRARAARVRAIYVEIERLMLDTKTAEAKELQKLGLGPCPREPEQTREIFRRFRTAEERALRRYVALQAALRKETTQEEFARLDAIK